MNINVLGTLEVSQASHAVALPASRKTRALLAYLVLSDRPQRREHLCDLLWDEGPDDPRAALRWSLSKLRTVIDTDSPRLMADRDAISIEHDDLSVDLRVAAALGDGAAHGDVQQSLVALRQPLLAGLDFPSHAMFQSWLGAERASAERMRRALLQQWVVSGTMAPEERLPWCREWLEADPFHTGAAAQLQATLQEMGRTGEARDVGQHFAAAVTDAGLPAPTAMAVSALTTTSSLVTPTEAEMLQRQKIQFCRGRDGVRIAYASVGEGPPLVKAANWLNHLELDWNAPIWAPLFHQLARDHRFIRYDERGNGMSQTDDVDISFDAFVRDLEAVVDAAGVERFPLLGLSQGCAVAIEYAVRHPDRVSHLILWGGYASGWRVEGSDDLRAEREAIITLVRQGWGRTDAIYRQLVTATFMPSATSEELDWFDGFQRNTVTALNAARFLEVFADIDVRARLPQVAVPTLVMHARGDRRIPLSVGAALAAEIPDAEFVALDSENHLLLGREPASAVFVAHVRQFLAASPSS
ncbi:hypothetical protein BH10PSE17_BH10PSE17_15890 [soil metagenome]